jgi:hypothetical protein
MKRYLAAFAATILIAAAGPVWGQDSSPQSDLQVAQGQPAPADQSDQQDMSDADYQKATEAQPGVARISVVQGDVSMQRGDNGEWVAVTQNAPISVDDRVSTGDKSRAELELDWANVLRMSERATARVAGLSRQDVHLQVGQGLVTYNVLRGNAARSVIDTPNSSIRPLEGEGEYRIVVNSDSETKIIVRRGSVEVSTPQGSTRVDAGKMITVQGTEAPQYQVSAAPPEDSWDQWNRDRNHGIRSAQSWRNTNPYYTGTEDLDNHGVWTEIPDYGPVWTPTVGPGWAPYRVGRWVYEPYYGWTWVSYEPWGWAPYHYGRWFVYGGNWVWWPGPVAVYPGYYPIWAPAYVSFFGWGGPGFGFGIGFGFGFGFGRVGWLPCGPGDFFHPWFGRFGGRVNVVNTTIVNHGVAPLAGNRGTQFSNFHGALTSERTRSGISSMEGSQFGKSGVPTHQPGFSAASFKQASMMTGKMPVSPSRQSYSPTNRAPGESSVRNATASSQHFFNPLARTSAASNVGARTSGMNSGSRAAVNSGAKSAGTSGSSRTLTPPQHSATSGAATGRTNQPSASHPATSTAQGAQGSQAGKGGWQHYSPSAQSPYGRSPYGQSPYGGSRGGAYGGYSRPPLNMNRPIVRPRGGYPGAPGGVYRGAPQGGATRGTQSAPPSGGASRGGTAGGSSHGGSHPSGGHAGGGHSR